MQLVVSDGLIEVIRHETKSLNYALVKFPPVAAKIERYGHYVLPVVLIAIGLEILSGFFHG